MRAKVKIVAIIMLLFSLQGTSQQLHNHQINKLKLLDVYELPHNLIYNNTTVGGLSGIDYDASNDRYYMICDDRSAINPARYYTAKITINQKQIDTIYFTGVDFLIDEKGQLYPSNKQDPKRTPDPEALRYNPITQQMIWSSEGERIVNSKDTILSNPSLTIIQSYGKWVDSLTWPKMTVEVDNKLLLATDSIKTNQTSINKKEEDATTTKHEIGKWIDTISLPANLYMKASLNGPRQNGVLEGLTFADNYKTLYTNVEEPLYEDGPKADLTPNKAFVRLYKFDVATKKNTAQYAYELDPVAYAPIIPGAFKVNGIPDLLDIGNNQLLVIERSFSTGRLACTIKLFKVKLKGATDITNNPSLLINKVFKPVKKQLLLNMDELGVFTDNIEGVTFGPVLPNGHGTLVFVADNNFAAYQRSQFFLFEIIP